MPSYYNDIARLERDIADIQKVDAYEAKKEVDISVKHHRALEDAQRTTSASTKLSKLKDADRSSHDIASIRKKRADFAARLAQKNKDLRSYHEKQSREDQSAQRKTIDMQKKIADEQKRMIRERDDHERRLREDLHQRAQTAPTPIVMGIQKQYDFFISHASEDKDSFVRALAGALTSLRAELFYDEATLRVGDSLRRKIDAGLAQSRFGFVVLSEHFFRKEWPQRELDGLVALETGGASRILPIWHKISKDEVAAKSPTLADKVALNTSTKSVAEIAGELYSMLEV